MNSRQLQYAVTLSEIRNFSQAAESLDISQPAFSKQIISLENELGIKLFDRSTTPLTLTPAGEFFIEKAKDLLFEEDVLLKTMEQYKTGESGKLVIGIPPFRSLYMMPKVVTLLKDCFPGLQVKLVELGISILKKGLLEGEYDFAIMNLPVNEPEFAVIPLESDTLVLAVPNNLMHLLDNEGVDSPVDLTCCERLPFVTVGKEQEMRKLFDKLCMIAGIQPKIYVEVTAVTTVREMVREGIAAAILPKQFMQYDAQKYDVTLFELKQDEYIRQPAIVTRRGQFISKYAEFAIDKLKGSC